MKKEIMVAFCTSEELKSALEVIARKEGQSLSSAIKLILIDHLTKNHGFPKSDRRERRQYPRKHVVIPAYVKTRDTEYGAVIVDLSLSGIRVSVSGECVSRMYDGLEKSRFEAFFALSAGGTVKVVCEPERVMPSSGTIQVGASFVDADFADYQRVQQYLM